MELVLKIAILLLGTMICTLVFLITYKVRNRNSDTSPLQAALEQTKEREERLKNISDKVFKNKEDSYRQMQLYLARKGVNFMMKRTVDPVEFMAVKVLIGIIAGFIAFLIGGFVLMLILAIAGYYTPNLIVHLSNKSDNKAMLLDIKEIYEILKLKTESGLFLTDSLLQCFKVAQNSRLKAALLELTSEIKARNNISDALTKFEIKFDNKYVKSFAGVIRQGLETGDTLSSIENISKQLVSVQEAMDIELDAKTNANVQITEILVLIEIMVLVFYALVKFGSGISIPF
jgi:pilus assembly protein TadC